MIKAEIEIPVDFKGRDRYGVQITAQEVDDNGVVDEIVRIIDLEKDDDDTRVVREIVETGSRQEVSLAIPSDVTKVKVIIDGEYGKTVYKLI